MAVVLFTTDLVCSSRVTGTGAAVRVARNPTDLLAAEAGQSLVILDLESPGADPAELMPRLRALNPPPARVIAFGPHVHTARLQVARDAGCDEVLTRGQFYAQLNEILSGAKHEPHVPGERGASAP